MKTYLHLFIEFFKTGLFAIGGGLATLPFLRDIADKYPWFTTVELTDMIAISESTPGPIGVNMSTFAGYRAAGILGGVVATLSLVLPSVIIIVVISSFMKRFKDSVIINRGFYAIRAATAGLIAGAIFDVFLISFFNTSLFGVSTNIFTLVQWQAIALFIGLLCLIKIFPKVHPIVFLIAGALIGIILKF